jgi:hypothetical protein
MRSALLRLVLTAVLFIPALGGSSLAYVCEMDGKIRRKCCCDHEAPNESDCTKLEKRGCCDVRSTGGEPITKSTRTVSGSQPPASAALMSTIAGIGSTAESLSTRQCFESVANGPPIFLRNCSLLR